MYAHVCSLLYRMHLYVRNNLANTCINAVHCARTISTFALKQLSLGPNRSCQEWRSMARLSAWVRRSQKSSSVDIDTLWI